MNELIIRAQQLVIGYGGQPLLRELNFDVKRGEVFAILGGSGSGKSTLLKHMIGLYPPLAGHIYIENVDIGSAQADARDALLRKIGVMYQSGALFGSMSLAENVRLPLEEFTDLPDEALELIARMKLDLVGLEKFADRLPSEVSGGMQKRAAIARAMALDPEILFLDEPSAGLDPVTAAELDALIMRLNQALGVTFVVVTHELASIFAIAQRVIMLDVKTKGIIAEGTPRQLRDEPPNETVRRFFHREPAAQST